MSVSIKALSEILTSANVRGVSLNIGDLPYGTLLKYTPLENIYTRFIGDAQLTAATEDLHDMILEQYQILLTENLHNIYKNSATYFTILQQDQKSFYYYQLLYCAVITVKIILDLDKEVANYRDLYAWASCRQDPELQTIIRGPTIPTSLSLNPYAMYIVYVSPLQGITNYIDYRQMSLSQMTLGTLQTVGNNMLERPNVFDKTPNSIKKYRLELSITSGNDIHYDEKNNLVYTPTNMVLYTPNGFDRTDVAKLQAVFRSYNRIRISNVVISPNAFITPIEALNKVYLVFNGVHLNSFSGATSNVSSNYLTFGGSFALTNQGYHFTPDAPMLCYDRQSVVLDKFGLYVTNKPKLQNEIVTINPNILIHSTDVFQRIIMLKDTNNSYHQAVDIIVIEGWEYVIVQSSAVIEDGYVSKIAASSRHPIKQFTIWYSPSKKLLRKCEHVYNCDCSKMPDSLVYYAKLHGEYFDPLSTSLNPSDLELINEVANVELTGDITSIYRQMYSPDVYQDTILNGRNEQVRSMIIYSKEHQVHQGTISIHNPSSADLNISPTISHKDNYNVYPYDENLLVIAGIPSDLSTSLERQSIYAYNIIISNNNTSLLVTIELD